MTKCLTPREIERFIGTLKQRNGSKRHTTVSMKTIKRGWSNVEVPNKVIVETMLLYNNPPYIRDKRQKTFDLTTPREELFSKIEKWWNEKAR